ncbi:FkbM family methyltransferase [Oryzifoliimicrobium ureilyticus]|uniref:FkbM family methyltransferase n=1 Tax=Oryzifoliimicrobium ureilyticus TaxID=3113724 RepID=UPI003076139A
MNDFLFERSLTYANAYMALRGRKTRFTKSDQSYIEVRENQETLVICRKNRTRLYKGGLAKRLDRLNKSYLLHLVDPTTKGAFIDCGANIGELGFFARQRNFDYHPFEPEALEASSCDRNHFAGAAKTNRLALWHEETVLKFYSKPATGDSSVIEMNDYSEVKTIPTTTLDKYVASKGISRIAVLKIEAEGAEPEVLAGAENALAVTDFITVDGGFERGKEKATTAPQVINTLLHKGFELVSWDQSWGRFLFRSTVVSR